MGLNGHRQRRVNSAIGTVSESLTLCLVRITISAVSRCKSVDLSMIFELARILLRLVSQTFKP